MRLQMRPFNLGRVQRSRTRTVIPVPVPAAAPRSGSAARRR
jgi:hypothetical protein